jgi:hypothetical protein
VTKRDFLSVKNTLNLIEYLFATQSQNLNLFSREIPV